MAVDFTRRITAIAALSICTAPFCAQSIPSAAPLPAQLATAKTAFLANGGTTLAFSVDGLTIYNNAYQDLAKANLYRLTTSPADADLVLEISSTSTFKGDTDPDRKHVKLVIRDRKTQSLLWTLSEEIRPSARDKTYQKNIADSVANLVADLSHLVNGDTVSPNSAEPTKTRLSDEGSK